MHRHYPEINQELENQNSPYGRQYQLGQDELLACLLNRHLHLFCDHSNIVHLLDYICITTIRKTYNGQVLEGKHPLLDI